MKLSDLEKVKQLQMRAESMNNVLEALEKQKQFTITIPAATTETVYSIILTPEFYGRVRNEIVGSYNASLQAIREELEDLGVESA